LRLLQGVWKGEGAALLLECRAVIAHEEALADAEWPVVLVRVMRKVRT
jgi:hypothetical protein